MDGIYYSVSNSLALSFPSGNYFRGSSIGRATLFSAWFNSSGQGLDCLKQNVCSPSFLFTIACQRIAHNCPSPILFVAAKNYTRMFMIEIRQQLLGEKNGGKNLFFLNFIAVER